MALRIQRIKMDDVSAVQNAVNVLHAAFEERLRNNLNYIAATITLESFLLKYKDAIGLEAVVDDEIAGVVFLKIKKDSGQNNFAYLFHLAVLPKYARKGLGTALAENALQIALQRKCAYMECDTAVTAYSAIRMHQKNGYVICGLASFKSTNYYSYIFRKPLVSNCRWNSRIYCKVCFCVSFAKCKFFRNKFGEYRGFAKIIKRFI